MKKHLTVATLGLLVATAAYAQLGLGVGAKAGLAIASDVDGGNISDLWTVVGIEAPLNFRVGPTLAPTIDVSLYSRGSQTVVPFMLTQRFGLGGYYFGAGLGLQFINGETDRGRVNRTEYVNKFILGTQLAPLVSAELTYFDSKSFDGFSVTVGVRF